MTNQMNASSVPASPAPGAAALALQSHAPPVLTGENIQQVFRQSPTAAKLCAVLSKFDRFTRETDLIRMYKDMEKFGQTPDKDDFMQAWKALSSLGLGSIVYGRGKNNDRFIWEYALTEVAQIGLSGKLEEGFSKLGPKAKSVVSKKTRKGRKAAQREEKVEEAPKAQEPTIVAQVSHVGVRDIFIPIRKNLGVVISAPRDLNSDEVEYIHMALNRLAKSA